MFIVGVRGLFMIGWGVFVCEAFSFRAIFRGFYLRFFSEEMLYGLPFNILFLSIK